MSIGDKKMNQLAREIFTLATWLILMMKVGSVTKYYSKVQPQIGLTCQPIRFK